MSPCCTGIVEVAAATLGKVFRGTEDVRYQDVQSSVHTGVQRTFTHALNSLPLLCLFPGAGFLCFHGALSYPRFIGVFLLVASL